MTPPQRYLQHKTNLLRTLQRGREPTDAEIDELIAIRAPEVPPWVHEDVRRFRASRDNVRAKRERKEAAARP